MSAGNGRTELCDYEHEMSVLSQLDDAEKTIEALQQANEQLQAQVAQHREALTQVQHDIDCAECRDDLDGIKGYIDEVLSDTPAEYHNPADMAALEKAREAIKAAWSIGGVNAAMDKASEAIAAIDKIGGSEDV